MGPIKVISFVGLQRSRLVLGEAFGGNQSWPMESRFSFREKSSCQVLFFFKMCDAGSRLSPTVAHTVGSICVTILIAVWPPLASAAHWRPDLENRLILHTIEQLFGGTAFSDLQLELDWECHMWLSFLIYLQSHTTFTKFESRSFSYPYSC